MKFSFRVTILLSLFTWSFFYLGNAQSLIEKAVRVSDIGSNNTIDKANSTRNIAVSSDGAIYAVFSGTEGIRVAKSTDNGKSFTSSVQVFPYNPSRTGVAFSKPEIAINESGDVFVVWVLSGNQGSFSAGDILLSKSIDDGVSFSAPVEISNTRTAPIATARIAVRNNDVFVRSTLGTEVYYNNTKGEGAFNTLDLMDSFTFSSFVKSTDVFIDTKGTIYTISDDPQLRLFKSENNGQTFSEVVLSPTLSREVFLSSYALTETPIGTFIFAAGGSNGTSDEKIGYRIKLDDGQTTTLPNFASMTDQESRTLYADRFGTLIDGFINGGQIKMNVSYDQGNTYDEFIDIDTAVSHSINTNPTTGDITVVYEKGGQIFMDVFEGYIRNIRITSPTANPILLCQEETLNVDYKVSGPFPFITNPEFKLILSDQNGSFDTPDAIELDRQVVTSTGNYAFSVQIPASLISSTNYRIKIESDNTQSNILSADIGVDIAIAGTPNNISECDNGTGRASFDLSSNTSIIAGTTGGVVSYHLLESEAILGASPLTNTYISSSDKIWARLETPTTARCKSFEVTSFDITVVSPNFIQDPLNITPLEYCDNITSGTDTDGFVVFDLTQKAQDLLTLGNNISDYNFEYFEDSGLTVVINTPEAFVNTVKDTQLIYATVTQKSTPNCSYETNFRIMVNPNPVNFNTGVPLEVCDDDTDGISMFNLLDAEAIVKGTISNPLNYTYTYHTSQDNAIAGTSQILTPNSFTNTTLGSQRIYLRLQESDPNCFKLIPVNLKVNKLPEILTEDQYVICVNDIGASFISSETTLLPALPINTGLDNFTYDFEWYRGNSVGTGIRISSVDNNVRYTPDTLGFYTVLVKNKTTACESSKTVEVVESIRPEKIEIEILTNSFESDNAFKVNVTGRGDYEFSLDGENWQDSNVFNGVKGGAITVFTRDKLNCSMLSEVTQLLDYPKFFTPNEDGFNDFWNIESIDGRTVFITRIFDRNGKLLTTINSNTKGWDGTSFGHRMPIGQYWFVIEYADVADGIKKVFKASFALKR